MTGTSYAVRIWRPEKYVGKRVTSYRIVWFVGDRRWRETFRTLAAAESFRAELLTALRKGEAFNVETGRPVSSGRTPMTTVNWYAFACMYIDMKWPDASPKHRKSIAETLAAVTPVLLMEAVSEEEAKHIRSALFNWGYNARRRGSAEQPSEVTDTLRRVDRHARALRDVRRPEVVRQLLDRISTRLDGQRAAGRSATLKRRILSNAFAYAVELGLLEANPLANMTWRAPRSTVVVDRRTVANPEQARALLDAVSQTPRSGPQLVAFFGCLYYSALRPEEAVLLRPVDLELPDAEGWGWITVARAAPETERQWSDDDTRRAHRQLKHRAVGESRRPPAPPALVALLRHHLTTWPRDDLDLLFRGERGDPLSSLTYRNVWRRAREKALTPAQLASPLAARPYDLRHAAVSTWLSAGVPAPQVAEWAGHSVEVLLRVYAKCVDGDTDTLIGRIDRVLR